MHSMAQRLVLGQASAATGNWKRQPWSLAVPPRRCSKHTVSAFRKAEPIEGYGPAGSRHPRCHGRQVQVRSVSPSGGVAVPPPSVPPELGDKTNLTPAEANTLRFLGWISFWAQLGLSVVSAGVLFFTVSTGLAGAQVPVYLGFTIGAVALSFVSTFLAFGYTRVARRVLNKAGSIKRAVVSSGILNSTRLNLIGLGLSIIGLQATVGMLVGKVLRSSSFNPLAQQQGSPVAFDVYSIQASTNVILAHFVSLIFATWALNAFNKTAIEKMRNMLRKQEIGEPGPNAMGPFGEGFLSLESSVSGREAVSRIHSR